MPNLVDAWAGENMGVVSNPVGARFTFWEPSYLEYLTGAKICPVSVTLEFANFTDVQSAFGEPMFLEAWESPHSLHRSFDLSDMLLNFSLERNTAAGVDLVRMACDPLGGPCVVHGGGLFGILDHDKRTTDALAWPVRIEAQSAGRIQDGFVQLLKLCDARESSI